MIGLFTDATASYSRFIAARLGTGVTVEPLTISAIERDPDARARANSADLAVTFVNRQREVMALVPNTKVVSISFIPSEETRKALAALDSLVARRGHFPASGFPADHEGRRPALRAACRASDRRDAGDAGARAICSACPMSWCSPAAPRTSWRSCSAGVTGDRVPARSRHGRDRARAGAADQGGRRRLAGEERKAS